ncbi:MAG: DUF58 domain-containing protein [Candidatus Rokuibacteriota bacterium]
MRRAARALRRAVERLRPHRTIWPTRDGWWCLAAAVGIGFAAMNTGNNLLYMLASVLLGLIIVSGLLSEQSMRRLRLRPIVPDELYAGRPALAGAWVANHKRRLASHSVTLETGGGGRVYLERIGPGAERLATWAVALPVRGRQRLPGVRVTTRFPFGLFVKATRVLLETEVIVFPALRPAPAARLREVAAGGPRLSRRRGRGHDLFNLREYHPGDDERLIHWRVSAKTRTLMVREMEADTTDDVRIVLGGAASDAARVEQAVSEAASLAVHLVRAGGRVELAAPGLLVPLGRGAAHTRRLLTALALWQPAATAAPARGAGRLRELHVSLG